MIPNQIVPAIIHPVNNGYINSLTPTINGTGEPGSAIDAVLNNMTYSAAVIENGTWSFEVREPLAEGSGYSLSVTQTNKTGAKLTSPAITFKADTQSAVPPTVTNPAQNQYINTAAPAVSGTGKAGATIEVCMGQNSYKTTVADDGFWSLTPEQPLAQGPHTARVTQIDQGNLSAPVERSFSVDTLAPVSPVVSRPADMGFENTPKPVISGFGEAGAEIELTVDGRQYRTTADTGGLWNMEISEALLDDVHVLSARQKDPAGNVSPENTLLFTVDTLLPQAPVIVSPANNQSLTVSRFAVSGTGEAGGTVQAIAGNKLYSGTVDNGGHWQINISDSLPEGLQTLKLYQIDQADNVSLPAKLTVNIDTSVPQVPAVIYPVQSGFVNALPFCVRGTGEPGAAVELRIAGREQNAKVNLDGSWSSDWSLPDKRAYSMAVYQQDAAGNRSPRLDINFRVDTGSLKAPTVSAPAVNSFVNTDLPAVSGTAQPGAALDIAIDGTAYKTTADTAGLWKLCAVTGLSQGYHSLQATQTFQGNLSPAAGLGFQVKTTVPDSPVILYPTENCMAGNTALVLSGSAEPEAVLELRLDALSLSAAADANGSWSAEIPGPLADGIHTLTARQTDRAGNTGAAAAVSFQTGGAAANSTRNDVPAIAKILYNPAGPEWTAQTIAVLTTDIPVSVNGVTGTSFSRLLRENGIHWFRYTEPSGTVCSTAAAVSWIDDLPPVIDLVSHGDAFKSDQTVNYYKYGPSGIKCALLSGASFSSGAAVSAEGCHTVSVCDGAGNISKKDFIIDKTPPYVSGAAENGVYTSDVTLTYSDAVSGIASATLNGRPFASGTVVGTNSSYTVCVCDGAGNQTRFSFRINK